MKRTIIAGSRRIEYTLIQTVRQNMLFQALPGGVIRVYAPRAMRLRDIDRMVRERAAQLLQMQADVDRRIEEDRRSHPVADGSTLLVEGKPHTLRLARAARPGGEVADGELRIRCPHPEDDAEVRGVIRSVLSARALARIRERVLYYAPRVGAAPGRITIREQKTRWGSCSTKHNLNFNWKLIMAPPQVLDYVVIHELCHMHEFNHSPRFWALVERQMPDYEAWKKWLKTHRDDLYL